MHNLANDSFNATDIQTVLGHMPGVVCQLLQRTLESSVLLTCISDNCRLIFGAERSVLEAEAVSFLQYIHPVDRTTLMSALSESAQTLGCCLWTGRILQPSGTVHWVHLTAQPSKDPSGILWNGLLALTLPPAESAQPLADSQVDERQSAQLQGADLSLASPLVGSGIYPDHPGSKLSDPSQDVGDMVLSPGDGLSPDGLNLETASATAQIALKHMVEERTEQLEQTIKLLLDEVVERTQVERHLRDREAFLHSIYNNVCQAIFVVDVDMTGEFRYADLNAACENIFGITSAQARGKTPEEILGDRTGYILRQQYQLCVTHQVGVVEEDAVHLETGTQWWRTQLTPLQQPDGTIYRIIGNTTDITRQKLIEKSLKRRDRLLQGVVIANRYLITHRNLDQALYSVLSALGAATGFDHIYVLATTDHSELELMSEWGICGTRIPQDHGSDTPWQESEAMTIGREAWYARLAQGEAIMGLADQQPEPIRDYLNHYGVRSILVEPIVIDDYTWGCICFEDCTYGYSWPANERSIFCTIAANIAGAIARYQAETDLMESTELLQLVLDNIPQAVFWKDRESVYLGCNITFAEAAGVEYTDDIIGKRDRDLCWLPEEAELYYQNDQFVMTNDTPLYHVIEPQRQNDGKEIICDVNKIPLHDQDGEVVGILGTFEDVTERQKAQEALRKSEAKLRMQTQELQSALDELQRTQLHLIQSEKMSSLGQLVAGIAHEINNPVNFIYGNIDHAHAYASDLLHLLSLYETHSTTTHPELQAERERVDLEFLKVDFPKLLESMEVGAVRIREIVSSLRTFSRMDEAERKIVDIHDGIDSTLMLLQSRMNPRCGNLPEVELERNYGNLPPVECFAGPLNQVFMNLLSNALDALDDAVDFYQVQQRPYQPRLTITTTVQPCSTHFTGHSTDFLEASNRSGFIVISITDNALGIPESVQSRLFDPFFTTKPVGKGTGMGLSISYQIITERHNGRLECLSKLGQGTTFIVKIPLLEGDRHSS